MNELVFGLIMMAIMTAGVCTMGYIIFKPEPRVKETHYEPPVWYHETRERVITRPLKQRFHQPRKVKR